MHDSQFLRRRPRVDSTTPTVITGAAAVIVRHRIFVDIVNDRSVYIRDRGVVVNTVVVPVRALIAATRISEAVVNAAIVADVRTPIARVPMVIAIIETPIRRRPQRAHVRGQHPRTRNPVITGTCVAPVTRRPHIVVTGSRRLAVIGKRRRRVWRLYRLIAGGILIVIRRGGWLVAWSGGLVGRRKVGVGGIAGRGVRRRSGSLILSLILRLIAGGEAREQQHGNQREVSHARNHGHVECHRLFRTRLRTQPWGRCARLDRS